MIETLGDLIEYKVFVKNNAEGIMGHLANVLFGILLVKLKPARLSLFLRVLEKQLPIHAIRGDEVEMMILFFDEEIEKLKGIINS